MLYYKTDGYYKTKLQDIMCYWYYAALRRYEAEMRFVATFEGEEWDYPTELVNGFTYPKMPIILDERPDVITSGTWGLIPSWAASQEPKEFLKKANTLNAMIETIEEKPSFKKYADNRCLILADSFQEWKHTTVGKKVVKTPYNISVPGDAPFAMAGIYSVINGVPTYSILTTQANELMADIHNSKKRMPVILSPEEEKLWLQRDKLEPYHNRTEVELVAVNVGEPEQNSLF
jgi:putative SOS response-associated peptidase YedK